MVRILSRKPFILAVRQFYGWGCGSWIFLAAFTIHLAASPGHAARGQLELNVVDQATGEPVAVQLRLTHQSGRLVRAPHLTREGDWQVFDGRTVLALAPGTYRFEMQRGLEYRTRTGHFLIKSGAADSHHVEMVPFVRMRDEGWWSGDLGTTRESLGSLALRALATDVEHLTLTTADNRGRESRAEQMLAIAARELNNADRIGLTGIRDVRPGGEVLLYGASHLLKLPATTAYLPGPFATAQLALEQPSQAVPPVHIHVSHVTSWNMPTWVALGLANSVGVLHDGIGPGPANDAAGDRPRDLVLFPDVTGLARWAQHVYFQLLESGHRIAPGAGSSGVGGQRALGTNRVYVHCGRELTPSAWSQGLRAGQVMVTNGPLLRATFGGELPGHVFQSSVGEPMKLEIEARLSTRQKIRYLEIVQNGRPVHQVRLEDWVAKQGQLPPVVFEQSGWALVRAVADEPGQYFAAMTGPVYVEIGDRPRISREAAAFFLEWVYARARLIQETDPRLRREILTPHRTARDYWQQKIEYATVD